MQMLYDPFTRTVVDANAAAAALYGYSREEIIGRHAGDLVLVNELDMESRFQELLERGSLSGRRTHRTASGAEREIESTATLLMIGERQLVHVWMFDVTDRVQAEAERSRLARVVDATSNLVAIGDLNRQVVTYMNPAGRSLLAVGADETDFPFPPLVHPDDTERLFSHILPTAERDGIWRGELRVVARDGRVVPLSMVLTMHFDNRGRPLYISTVSRDITAEKAHEAQILAARRAAENASRAKSTMFATLSHELRAPLGAVLGFAQILRSGHGGNLQPAQIDYIDEITAGAGHLLRLVNDALDLARIEAGVVDLRPAPVDVAQVARQAASSVGQLASARDVRLDVRASTSIGPVIADASRIQQVLLNYLSNAIKYGARGGLVVLELAPEGEAEVRFTVRDAGPGIAAADLGRLFVEFERLSPDGDQQGTGLGLAITKRIVEAMGGRVAAESVLGEGSAFHAIIPRNGASTASGG